ncbi:hypothetical protein VPH35_031117 [Triticum aestivum]
MSSSLAAVTAAAVVWGCRCCLDSTATVPKCRSLFSQRQASWSRDCQTIMLLGVSIADWAPSGDEDDNQGIHGRELGCLDEAFCYR